MPFYKQRPVLEIECLMTALSWISVVATKTQSLQGIPLPSMFSNLEEIFPDNKFMNASESISFSLFKASSCGVPVGIILYSSLFQNTNRSSTRVSFAQEAKASKLIKNS